MSSNTTTTVEKKSTFLTDFTHQLTGEVTTPTESKIAFSGIMSNVIHAGCGFAALFLPMKFGKHKARGWKIGGSK